ncbi:hypothetical protein OPV22_026622 [Ensete ventricosum]|uniref:Reverse transcriptase Ty1/copia-type domain-containing protein n=1 Tax=Ensete ventricosum TaxID=4639 RepID=A0AAV8QM23_ENSVE|nr:hypothetical protein OPV22_026622 [Ensete ventricosum]
MSNAKPVGSPLASHFKLCLDQSPSSDEEKEKMQKVPYASAVGSLMYAMICTRPDIAYAVGVTSRFLVTGKEHWAALKWIFRYLKGSSKVCLSFGGGPPMLTGGAVLWQSRLQRCIALSTTEAEYIAATEKPKKDLTLILASLPVPKDIRSKEDARSSAAEFPVCNITSLYARYRFQDQASLLISLALKIRIEQ